MKKLMFTLALLSAFSGQAQAELTWKKIQAGASGGMAVPVITPNIIVGSGIVKATGYNAFGQLGDGTTTQRNSPVNIANFNGAKQCSSTGYHTVCIMKDGTVKVVGHNKYGQLGVTTNIGTDNPTPNPITIPDFAGATQCSAGYFHTLCIMNDGSVKATGYNVYGQLGDGTTANKSTPVAIADFNGAKECSASDSYTVCIMNDGSVKAAGNNTSGQLGDGTTAQRNVPVTSAGFSGATECSTSVGTSGFFTVCVMSDGTVKVAGNNRYGQLGVSTNVGTDNPTPNPITIVGFNGAKQCSAGGRHTVCVMNDGSVKATGYNNAGQLGDSTTTLRTTPVNIVGFNGAKQCSAGESHTVCIMNDGTVKATGYNYYGKLGDGTTVSKSTPVAIADFNGATQCSSGNHTVCLEGGTREELPTCDSLTDFFAKTADGTKYVCKNNVWTEF